MDDRTPADIAAGLRALADALDGYDGPPPTHLPELRWLIFGRGETEQTEDAAAVVRALGGHWDKEPGIDFLAYSRGFGGGVTAEVWVDRAAVCERVVTGTREVTRTVLDPDAPPAPTIEVTTTVEDVEWRCKPLLAAAEQAGASS